MSLETSNRGFPHRNLWSSDHQKSNNVYYLVCHECRTEDTLPIKRHSLAVELVKKAFQNKGWIIGTTRATDLCPACIERKHKEREQRATARETAAIAAKAVTTLPTPAFDIGMLSREQLQESRQFVAAVLDRQATIGSDMLFIEQAIYQLVDRHADLNTRMTALTETVSTLLGLDEADVQTRIDRHREEDPMFTRLLGGGRGRPSGLTEREVRLSYTRTSHQTFIIFSAVIAKELGYTKGDRAFINIGKGEQDGMIAIERTQDARNSLLVQMATTGTGRICTTHVKPINVDEGIKSERVKFGIADGMLVIHLPEEYRQQADPARSAMETVRLAAAQ